jgi:hypothetical protein
MLKKSSVKPGRPRDQAKRSRILEALTGDPNEYFNVGTPPYSVAQIAVRLEMDSANLRKALLQLEQEGSVIREVRKMETWNAIARDMQGRNCLCFWNTETMEKDRLLSADWSEETALKGANAFERLLKSPS